MTKWLLLSPAGVEAGARTPHPLRLGPVHSRWVIFHAASNPPPLPLHLGRCRSATWLDGLETPDRHRALRARAGMLPPFMPPEAGSGPLPLPLLAIANGGDQSSGPRAAQCCSVDYSLSPLSASPQSSGPLPFPRAETHAHALKRHTSAQLDAAQPALRPDHNVNALRMPGSCLWPHVNEQSGAGKTSPAGGHESPLWPPAGDGGLGRRQ